MSLCQSPSYNIIENWIGGLPEFDHIDDDDDNDNDFDLFM